MKQSRLRILSWLIMCYMVLAFLWWAILLYQKNRETFTVEVALLECRHEVPPGNTLESHPAYQKLLDRFRRQQRMIIGEGLVFLFTLAAGLWFINDSYHREIKAGQRQKNFLLSITHELKSPLASIQLVLETLLKRNVPEAQRREFLQAALDENERLNTLVENLLLSARLDAGYEPAFEELNLGELAQRVVNRLQLRHPDARILLEAASDLPLLWADEAGMQSILYNLIENAIKYGGDPPQVTVRLIPHEDELLIEVADNGRGIPAEERQAIFEKFYRIGSEDTRQTKGTGLGLFIVDQVVKAHGGTVNVRDNQPKGAVFSIRLPINQPRH